MKKTWCGGRDGGREPGRKGRTGRPRSQGHFRVCKRHPAHAATVHPDGVEAQYMRQS